MVCQHRIRSFCHSDNSLVGVKIEPKVSHVRSTDKRRIVREVVHHDRESLEAPSIHLAHAGQWILNFEVGLIGVALHGAHGGIHGLRARNVLLRAV